MKNNPIKLIASDMDGTLLDSNGILNPEFFTMFEDLSNKDIMFVAASGRQYYNLLKLFNLIKDKIIFIIAVLGFVLQDLYSACVHWYSGSYPGIPDHFQPVSHTVLLW